MHADLNWNNGFHPKSKTEGSLSGGSPGSCSVSPEDAWQLLNPITFGLPDASLQSLNDRSVGHLNLSVALGIGHRGITVVDLVLLAKVLKLPVFKLCAVVSDDCSWNTEAADDALPQE
ncbi:hypothetical protein Dimus_038410 [Dionaea muscipula]